MTSVLVASIIALSLVSWLHAARYNALKQALNDQKLIATVATRSAANNVVVYNREWTRFGNAGVFAFSDDEWVRMTNAYPENLRADASTGQGYFEFVQGRVFRKEDSAVQKKLLGSQVSEIMTNTVLFYK